MRSILVVVETKLVNVCECILCRHVVSHAWFVSPLPQEYQLVIGLSNWMLWAAYFFAFLTFYSVTILLMCLIFFAKASV